MYLPYPPQNQDRPTLLEVAAFRMGRPQTTAKRLSPLASFLVGKRVKLLPCQVTGLEGAMVSTMMALYREGKRRVALLDLSTLPATDDPLNATSYGIGQLIMAALNAKANHIILFAGEQSISDGGAGLAQALGYKLYNETGSEIGRGVHHTARIARIEATSVDPRLANVQVDFVASTFMPLCGPHGAATTLGQHLKLSPTVISRLQRAYDQFAFIVKRDLGRDVYALAGGGSAGGLAAGCAAFLQASIVPLWDVPTDYQTAA